LHPTGERREKSGEKLVERTCRGGREKKREKSGDIGERARLVQFWGNDFAFPQVSLTKWAFCEC